MWSHVLFMSTVIGDPVDSVPVFVCDTDLAESGILLFLLNGVQAFLPDVALFYVLQSCQLDDGQGYLSYHSSLKKGWDDEACVGWVLYVCSSSGVLDVPDCEVSFGKKNAQTLK